MATTRQEACSQRSACACSRAARSGGLMHLDALKQQIYCQRPRPEALAVPAATQRDFLRETALIQRRSEQFEPIVGEREHVLFERLAAAMDLGAGRTWQARAQRVNDDRTHTTRDVWQPTQIEIFSPDYYSMYNGA
ncbi:hypothetical protein OPT61_g7090 [Boeremia exigua]|uniref:Uncharacterized protein n=1 Tax=Boeremia exigua TaxID=749465 RepID=A0ACC2I474_9PLEO|nr:hypothetical protein OPT61_g7090 [Boeremia exigua]